jgi:hypothetical protein
VKRPAICTCEADDLYERQFLDDGRHFPDCPVARTRIGTTPDEIRKNCAAPSELRYFCKISGQPEESPCHHASCQDAPPSLQGGQK